MKFTASSLKKELNDAIDRGDISCDKNVDGFLRCPAQGYILHARTDSRCCTERGEEYCNPGNNSNCTHLLNITFTKNNAYRPLPVKYRVNEVYAEEYGRREGFVILECPERTLRTLIRENIISQNNLVELMLNDP